MKRSIIALFFILFTTKLSFADIVFSDGSSFPQRRSLEDQLPQFMQMQDGGFCHVFAAVRLLEAACYRKTGKRLNISEDYFILRHLSTELRKLNGYSSKEGVKAISTKNSVTYEDAGFSFETLRRIFESSSILLEDEFKPDDYYLDVIRALVEGVDSKVNEIKEAGEKFDGSYIPAEEYDFEKNFIEFFKLVEYLNEDMNLSNELRKCSRLSGERRRAQRNYHKLLGRKEELQRELQRKIKNIDLSTRNLLLSYIDKQLMKGGAKDYPLYSGNTGYHYKSKNKDLNKCLDGLRASKEDFSDKKGVELISKNIPYLCAGRYTYPNGTTGRHIAIRIGYKYKESIKSKLSWQIFDSNNITPEWGWLGACEYIIFITP